MKVKEESEKVSLKLNIQKTKITVSSSITSWQIDGETMETVRDFIFLCSKITVDGDCSHELKYAFSLEEKLWPASVQFSSVAQSCPTACSPMNRSMPGLPVHHQPRSPPKPMSIESVMPTQPSHPLLSPSLPALNLSQHQGLFQWVSSLHQVANESASVLLMNIQGWFL